MVLFLLVTLLLLLPLLPMMMRMMVVVARLLLLCRVALTTTIACPQLLLLACLPERLQHVCTCLQHTTAAWHIAQGLTPELSTVQLLLSCSGARVAWSQHALRCSNKRQHQQDGPECFC
jgi:hypothetical protein